MRRLSPTIAFLANLVGFGLGYLYIGRMRYAIVLACVVPLVATTAGGTGLIFSSTGFALTFLLVVVLALAPFIHAPVLARRSPEVSRQWYNRGWVYILWFVGSLAYGELLIAGRPVVFGYDQFRIPSNSMATTIEQGDFITARTSWKLPNTPQYGDMYVFRHPDRPDIKFVKRVVGLPGDLIDLENSTLIRNGEIIVEDYVQYLNGGTRPASHVQGVVVPDGHYYMLGDNRDRSRDSRHFGPVPAKLMHGLVVHRWFAFNDGIRFDRFPQLLNDN